MSPGFWVGIGGELFKSTLKFLDLSMSEARKLRSFVRSCSKGKHDFNLLLCKGSFNNYINRIMTFLDHPLLVKKPTMQRFQFVLHA